MQSLLARMRDAAALTEDAMRRYFAAKNTDTALYRAMEYGVMGGGKRIRPFLTLEFCRLLGGNDSAALPYAAAIEMIHNFSLIHDDMPCMDNDDLRRGRPTTHKAFGEAPALLAGDALIFSAFECALSNTQTSAENQNRAVAILASAAGADGMCEGQMLDMESDGKQIPFEKLLSLHAHKTGALIRAAAKLGVLAAGGDALTLYAADKARRQLARKIRVLGIVFKITPAERRTLDVHARTEQHGNLLGTAFLADCRADPFAQRGVPRVGERRRGRKAGRFHGFVDAVRVLFALAQPVRTVAHHQLRHAEPFERRRVPGVVSGGKSDFFLCRHFGKYRVNPAAQSCICFHLYNILRQSAIHLNVISTSNSV